MPLNLPNIRLDSHCLRMAELCKCISFGSKLYESYTDVIPFYTIFLFKPLRGLGEFWKSILWSFAKLCLVNLFSEGIWSQLQHHNSPGPPGQPAHSHVLRPEVFQFQHLHRLRHPGGGAPGHWAGLEEPHPEAGGREESLVSNIRL